MADPFSIIAGAVGVADVCVKLGTAIYRLRKDVGGIDDELDSLANDLEDIQQLCATVRDLFRDASQDASEKTEEQDDPAKKRLRDHLYRALQNCEGVVMKLHETMLKIQGSSRGAAPSKLDTIRKAIRKQLQESDLHSRHMQLAAYQNGLHMVLSMINLYVVSSLLFGLFKLTCAQPDNPRLPGR